MAKKFFFFSLTLFILTLGFFIWRSYSQGNLLSTKKSEIKTENKVLFSQEEVKNNSNIVDKKEINQKKIKKIVEGPIFGAIFLAKEKSLVYYSNQNFLKTDLNGQNRRSIGAHPFGKIEKINWSFNQDKVLIKDDSESTVVFDLEKKEFVTFPIKTNLMLWGNLNGQFFYEYFDSKKNRRILDSSFDLTGKTWSEVTDLPYEKALLAVNPLKNEALIFPDPKFGITGDIFRIDFSSGKKEKFLNYYKGMDFLFSPSGKKILESYVKKDGRISLGIIDSKTGFFQDLNFPSSVKKCVWMEDETEILCAAIISSEKVSLPEDWENKKVSFQDVFWKINVNNGKQTRLFEMDLEERTDAENLFLDDTETKLFFIDRITGGLFQIDLTENKTDPKN